MNQKTNHKPTVYSISSSKSNTTYVLKLNTIILSGLVIIFIIISFYGGVLYGRSTSGKSTSTFKVAKPLHEFAIGLIIYVSKHSITVNNEDTKSNQTFNVNNNTIISVNGHPADLSDIKAGNIALVRMNSSKPHLAGVVIVNSHFTD